MKIPVISTIRAKIHLKNARNFARRKQWLDAVNSYRQVLSCNDTDGKIWEQYGHVLKESGFFEEAALAYEKAIFLNENPKECYIHLAHLLKENKNIDNFQNFFKKYVNSFSKNESLIKDDETPDFEKINIHNKMLKKIKYKEQIRNNEEFIDILKNTNLFDVDWYRNRYNIDGDDLCVYNDYLSYKRRPYRKTSPFFDGEIYARKVENFSSTGYRPLIHYLKVGIFEGLFGKDIDFRLDGNNSNACVNYRPLCLSNNPLVSIIITNKDGARFLNKLFASIKKQTYKNVEIIFVDDCSNDNSIKLANSLGADKIIDIKSISSHSVGFAKANNLALEQANGEVILLQNNDTYLDINCIEFLVRALQEDDFVAAASPKIRFFEKFTRITLISNTKFSINLEKTLQEIQYKKYFIRCGSEEIELKNIISVLKNNKEQICIDFPIESSDIPLYIFSEDKETLNVYLGSEQNFYKKLTFKNKEDNLLISRNNILEKDKFFIINNAGGYEQSKNTPGDRGIEFIDGYLYNKKETVPYFCGCSVAIKRDVLFGEKLFYDEFIAYYEDSELSKRITHRKYKILYVPQALVYHKHSASNIEKSKFWRTYTFRNRYLFLFILAKPEERKDIVSNFWNELNHLKNFYAGASNLTLSEKGFYENIPYIAESADYFFRSFTRENKLSLDKKIGIFNQHWLTMGGGEAHALHIADMISQGRKVDIICTSDINLKEICSYFGINSNNFYKKIVREFNSDITREYEIFINASYQDQTISYAKTSFYVVSFPSRDHNDPFFLKNYYYLANSNYTYNWMKNYWSNINFMGSVVYPQVSDNFNSDNRKKKKIILSVGRFTSSGHTKSQLEIARAFCSAVDKSRDSNGWKLVLIGSVNDNDYVKKIQSVLNGYNHCIIKNAKFEEILENYKDAAIYVHASGLYMDEDKHPELLEHFGMAVAQSLCAGCFPVVYRAAGPREIVNTIGIGRLYNDIEELSEIFEEIFSKSHNFIVDNKKITLAQEMFSSKNARNKINSILDFFNKKFII